MTPQEPVQPPTGPVQLSVGLADTPEGQRLAVSLTVLLDAAGAKALGAAIADAASKMSASGLVAVGGVLNGGRL